MLSLFDWQVSLYFFPIIGILRYTIIRSGGIGDGDGRTVDAIAGMAVELGKGVGIGVGSRSIVMDVISVIELLSIICDAEDLGRTLADVNIGIVPVEVSITVGNTSVFVSGVVTSMVSITTSVTNSVGIVSGDVGNATVLSIEPVFIELIIVVEVEVGTGTDGVIVGSIRSDDTALEIPMIVVDANRTIKVIQIITNEIMEWAIEGYKQHEIYCMSEKMLQGRSGNQYDSDVTQCS